MKDKGKGRNFSDLCGEKKKPYLLWRHNITLFAQAIATLPKNTIKGIIGKHNSNKFCKGYDTWSQLVSMIFCQFANSPSVRDISNGLRSATGNLVHLGQQWRVFRGMAREQPVVQENT